MTEVPSTRRRAARQKPAPQTAPETAPTPTEASPAIDFGLLDVSLGFVLKRAQMALFQDFNRTFAAADIRPAQFSVLALIERNPGLKQSEISRALDIKRTNFVPLLDGLEARGLVKRKRAAGDRRSHALHLTPKGQRLTEQLKQLWAEHDQRVRDRVGDEGLRQLFEVLPRLLDFAEPLPTDDAEAESDAPAKRARAAAKPRRLTAAADAAPRRGE